MDDVASNSGKNARKFCCEVGELMRADRRARSANSKDCSSNFCYGATGQPPGSDNVRCQHKWKMAPHKLEGDGITNSSERDAPGQSCVYILSGPHEKEEYRIATYFRFPENVPVFFIALAKAGFYYTGYKDRVKCFSCGMAVENWIVGDDVFLARWHRENCLMFKPGGDPRNIPTIFEYPILCKGYREKMRNGVQDTSERSTSTSNRQRQQSGEVTRRMQNMNITNTIPQIQHEFRLAQINDEAHGQLLRNLDLKKEEERRKTFDKWPTYPAPFLPGALARNGFFYLGNLDRTQCRFCAGVLRNWAAGDVPEEQHRRHFPQCRMVARPEGASDNVPMSEEARRTADAADQDRLRHLQLTDSDPIVEPPDPPEEDQGRLALLYPLNLPVNRDMETLQARIQSFSFGWPARTRATPEEIAKAGFYFLGEADKTKCFYCNGGLQNWDRNDEPWMEHAKWFPGCAFIIRNKGQEFVRRLYYLHPNLNRPSIRHPVSFDIPPTDERPHIEIQDIIDMGFPRDRIQRMMRRKMAREGLAYASMQDLIDDLLRENPEDQDDRRTAESRENQVSSVTPAATSVTTAPTNASKRNSETEPHKTLENAKKTRTNSPSTSAHSSEATKEMQETLRVEQETERCKNCRVNPADTVLMPCGHLVSCSNCAKNADRCFVCNAKVQNHLKVYRA